MTVLSDRAVETVIAQELKPDTYTYLIVNESETRGKIGKSVYPSKRLRDLQASSPEKLSIYALIKGDREYALHNEYRHLRLHGEWFKIDEQLLAHFHQHRVETVKEIIHEPSEDYSLLVDDGNGQMNFNCPRCPNSSVKVVEVFFEEEGGLENPAASYLKLVFRGLDCCHTFVASICLSDAAYMTHQLVHRPFVRVNP